MQTLTESLARLTGTQPPWQGSLSVEGLVRRDAARGRWLARIRALDATGQTIGVREVQSTEADCAALTPAIVLVLAWLFDSRADAPPAPQSPSTAASAPTLEGPEPPPMPAASRTAAIPRFSGELSAGLSGAIGVNPEPTFGPSLSAQLNTPWRIALALGANYWAASRVPLADPVVSGSEVAFRALQASLALCVPLLGPGKWALASCWGGALGARFTRAEGLAEAANPARIYGGPSGAVRLGYGFRARWSATLECAGLAFGREDSFAYLDGDGERRVLYEPSRFGGWATLGLAARL